jgi:hypothetical protein
MNILTTFNDNNFEPTDYFDRPTVKAIIVNDNDEVLLFSSGLPGGGVEDGETNEQALERELMEEIGAKVSITRELGNVIAYRDELKLKYIFTGYECSLVSLGSPITIIDHEIGKACVWKKRAEVIKEMEQHIVDVKNNKETYEGDRYQRHIFNTEAALIFLKLMK